MEPVTTTSPAQAKEDVLASAGASIPQRDTIDRRIVNDVLQGTGHSIATTAEQPEGAWPELYSLPAPADDDHDGMPNDWELAHNLNPNDPTDRNNIGHDGYTQLEVYLNSLTSEIVTHIDDMVASHPEEFHLGQNYPNPFNPSTTINFTLRKSEYVQIMIYDQLGRLVKKLVDENKGKGINSVVWDGKNDAGDLVSSGIYFYSLKAGKNKTITRKMIVLK